MKESNAKPLDYFLHPYIFVLKEGGGIEKDLLDYKLLLLQVGQADILPSRSYYNNQKPSNLSIQLLKK